MEESPNEWTVVGPSYFIPVHPPKIVSEHPSRLLSDTFSYCIPVRPSVGTVSWMDQATIYLHGTTNSNKEKRDHIYKFLYVDM